MVTESTVTSVDMRTDRDDSRSRVKKLVREAEGGIRTILGSSGWVWMVIQFAMTGTLEKRPF